MTQLARRAETGLALGGDAERRLEGLPRLDWTAGLRRDALLRYHELGLPTRRLEAWKYTDLASAIATPTRLAQPAVAGGVQPLLAEGQAIVLVNGFLQGALPAHQPRGVTVRLLSDPESAALIDGRLTAALDYADKPLAALNTALFADGVLVHVAKGAAVNCPIEIVSVGQAGDEAVEFHPRCLVLLEEGASATVLERHVGTGHYVSNSVFEAVLGERSTLRHYKLQDESPSAVHVGTAGLALSAGASYEGAVVQLGAGLGRCEVHAGLNGAGASLELEGATLGAGRQHLDNTVFVTHRAVGGRSRQMFRTVLDDAARGVFQGLVLVERAAQKTDAHQLAQALLLSGQSEMDGKPALEIYADDVKCGHGATVGALDETALFYLRSRGLAETEAQRLLIEGFLVDAIDRVSAVPVRQALTAAVEDRLNGVRRKEVA